MLRQSLAAVGSMVLLSGVALAVQAQSVDFSGSYTGTLTLNPVTGLVTISGTGTATPFNFTTLFGTYNLLPNGVSTDGQGSLSDSQGNSLTSTFEAEEQYVTPFTGLISQTFTITGGTGLFAGTTGHAVGKGTFVITGPTTATFTESLHSVPEPSVIVILAASALNGAALLRRRKRKRATMLLARFPML